jgi:hypothetical protein
VSCIVLDNVPPVIEWTNPARGTFTQAGSINLAGNAYDIGGQIETFTINGYTIPVGNGQFYVPFPLAVGLNIFEAYIEDDSGNSAFYSISVLRGDYWAPDTWIDDAVGVMVTEGGLNTVEEIAEDYLATGFDLEQLLYDNLVINETFDLGFMSCDVSLAPTSATINPIDLSLESKSGYIDALVTISNLYVGVTADVSCSDEDVVYNGHLSATSITAQTPVFVSLDEDDNLVVTIGEITIAHTGLELVIEGVNETLTTALLNALLPMVIDYANQIIAEEIPPIIEEALADLELAFSFDLFGNTFDLEATFSELDIEEDGISLWLSANTSAGSYDPEVPEHDGSWYKITATPIFTPNTPGGNDYELGAALSINVINQMLYTVYRSGLLSFELNESTAPQFGFTWDMAAVDLETFFPGISDIAGEDAEVVIDLEPLLQPIIETDIAKDMPVQLQWGELFLHLAVKPDVGDPIDALTMVIALIAPVTIETNDAGTSLAIAIGSPELSLDVVDSMFLLPDSLLEVFLPGLVEMLLPILSAFIEEFELPAFEGYSISITELAAMGLQNAYVGVFGDLIVVEEEKWLMEHYLN